LVDGASEKAEEALRASGSDGNFDPQVRPEELEK